MGRSSYDRLTALDYSFLALEGFNADYDLVPDLHAFVECVTASFEDLRRVAGVDAETG